MNHFSYKIKFWERIGKIWLGFFFPHSSFHLTFLHHPLNCWKMIRVSTDNTPSPRRGAGWETPSVLGEFWERDLGVQQETRLPRHLLRRGAPNLCRGRNQRRAGRRWVDTKGCGRVLYLSVISFKGNSKDAKLKKLKHSLWMWQRIFLFK